MAQEQKLMRTRITWKKNDGQRRKKTEFSNAAKEEIYFADWVFVPN